uniref:Uncharacterized protein n=1 Tax=Oryza nivara TaxID=4536 RepID=A0A0E0IRP7_ORYNI
MVLVLPRLVRTPFTPILCTIRWRREGGEKQLCRISSSLVSETQLVPVQDIPAAGRVLDSQSSRILSLKYIGSHTRSGFLESIWASCHSIFALRPAERLDAYNILSLSTYIFPSSENDAAQQCSRRRSAALPAQDKPNTAMTKRERWAQKEARSLGIGETSQSDENCSSRKDWSKVFLLLYEMLRDVAREIRCANPF